MWDVALRGQCARAPWLCFLCSHPMFRTGRTCFLSPFPWLPIFTDTTCQAVSVTWSFVTRSSCLYLPAAWLQRRSPPPLPELCYTDPWIDVDCIIFVNLLHAHNSNWTTSKQKSNFSGVDVRVNWALALLTVVPEESATLKMCKQ